MEYCESTIDATQFPTVHTARTHQGLGLVLRQTLDLLTGFVSSMLLISYSSKFLWHSISLFDFRSQKKKIEMVGVATC